MTSERGRSYRKLSTFDQLVSVRLAAPMDVCLVTSEIVGPAGSGGIGTASTALARQLVAEGHRVTVLFTQVWNSQPYSGTSSWSNWVEQYRKLGVMLHHIPHQGDYADWQAKSWLVMEFLRTNSFDLVYFNEHHASGYYAICAKRARMAPFVHQTHCVITHGSMEWVLRHNDQYMRRASDLIMIGMERRCVEWADVVLSPSEYLLQEYARYGWRIPEKAYVHPYPLIRQSIPVSEQSFPVDELVFLGRLETRKGLWLFCDAVEQIAESLRGKTVTFMGRFAETAGVSVSALLIARAARWPFDARFATWFSTREALEYLQQPGKLAVMPSLADNSPCVVYECLEKQIPFISTYGSGAEELIAPDRRSDVLARPSAAALAEKLEAALTRGAKLGELAFQPEQSLRTWRAWHNWLSAEGAAKRQREAAGAAPTGAQAPDEIFMPAMVTEGGASDLAALLANRRHREGIGVPDRGVGKRDDLVLLNVMIDSGDTDLATLLVSFRAQSRNLGRAAGHLVLTSRGREFQEALADLLNDQAGPDDTPALVVGIEDLSQARQILLDADVAFFSGGEYQVDLSFYVRATALLTSGAASAVSCCVGQMASDGQSVEIAQSELPCGDLPAAAAVQSPLASPVWAISVPAVRRQLESLAIHDETFAQFLTSETLGQRLIHRCVLDQQSYRLLPNVAARRTGPKRRETAHWYRDLGAIAQDLGLATLAYPEAPPWFAMSSLGNLALPKGRHASAVTGLPARLSERLATDPATPVADRVRKLARRIGRPFLAAQLSVANGASHGLLDDFTPSAATESQGRKTDLLEALLDTIPGAGGPHAAAARDRPAKDFWMVSATPRSGEGQRNRSAGDGGLVFLNSAGLGPSVHFSKGLLAQRIDESLICRKTDGSPARLTLMDVPLDGQEHLFLVASAGEAATVDWELAVVDQLQGTLVMRRTFRTAAGERLQTSIPMPRMLGVLMIGIELAKRSMAGLKIESLKIA
jgi:glycosyltransferase involved in cell wall biosynthesis